MKETIGYDLSVDQERNDALKKDLLIELQSACSLEDLAMIKKRSLEFDERTNHRKEIHQAIIERFEKLLIEKTQEIL